MRKVTDSYNLKMINPRLSKEWHPVKNGKLTPKGVTPSSGRKVWWICKNKHEWVAKVGKRAHGTGCPYCSGKAVCQDNCLKTKDPEISSQWHPTKNGNLTPKDVTPGSGRKVWWICGNNHEWIAKISYRSDGTGCPYCSGKAVCLDNCLQTKNPKLTREWHPTKNKNLTPKDITPGRKRKVWWQCKKGHEWMASVSSRNLGTACPFCSKRKAKKKKSTQNIIQILFEQWHPLKNGNLMMKDVSPNSHKKVWWQCKNGHEWKAVIAYRSKGSGCPYCAGRLASKDRNLKVLNPELAEQWHPVKNGKLAPEDILPGAHRKVWWQCNKGHEWEAFVFSRSKGTGCPYCIRKKS